MRFLTGLAIFLLILAALFRPALAQPAGEEVLFFLTSENMAQLWWRQSDRLILVDLEQRFGLGSSGNLVDGVFQAESLYLLDDEGRIYSFFAPERVWTPMLGPIEAVDIEAAPEQSTLYSLDRRGGIYQLDLTSGSYLPLPLETWNMRAETFAYRSSQNDFMIFDQQGSCLFTGEGKIQAPNPPLDSEVKDFVWNSQSEFGLLMDRAGRLYALGDVPPEKITRVPELGQEIAVGLEFSSQYPGEYYLLDVHGSIFSSTFPRQFSPPEPSSGQYVALVVGDGKPVWDKWKNSFSGPALLVEPEKIEIPYWRSGFRFQVVCDQAYDLTEFVCRILFNPEVLSPQQVFKGELFETAYRSGIFLSGPEETEGLLEVVGLSLDKRSGRGITGSGVLFEVEMEVLTDGFSELDLVSFEASSASLPGQVLPMNLFVPR